LIIIRIKFDKIFFIICLKNNLKVVVANPNSNSIEPSKGQKKS